MPFPEFKFEDDLAGMPPHPVPIRFACYAANWSPALFRTVATGLGEISPPLITVYEYDPRTRHYGEVHPSIYENLAINDDAPPCDQLAQLPANHFVWSDQLIQAYSDYIDLTSDRDSAHLSGAGIRWNPSLHPCTEVVAESPDLSVLLASINDRCSLRVSNKTCTALFDGQQATFKEDKGLGYIIALLKNPGTSMSVQDLYLTVNPSPSAGQPNGEANPDRGVRNGLSDENMDESGNFSAPEDDDADELNKTQDIDQAFVSIDEKTINDIKDKLNTLNREISEAESNVDQTEVERLEDERQKLIDYLKNNLDHNGRPRRSGGTGEKKRKSIRNAIARTIESIKKAHPSLGLHFEKSINTGFDCSYLPSGSISWDIKVVRK